MPHSKKASAPARAMGETTGKGASWILATTILSKGATFIAQVLLGMLLMPEHFGLFAAATSIAAFLNLLRDGGAGIILVQRGAAEYPKLVGPLFWMGIILSSLSALIVAALAQPLEQSLQKPGLAPMLWVMAASFPLQAPSFTLAARLRVDLRFPEFSKVQLASGVLRQATMVLLAFLGFEAMSFAWPYVACALFETLAFLALTREPIHRHRPQFALWKQFLSPSAWILFSLIANLSLDLGPYLILALILDSTALGYFFFAFQLTAQTGVLLGYGAQQVLFPVLATLNNEPQRQAAAVLRALRALMVVGALVCILLTVVIEPLQLLLWRQRWVPAVPAIMILGAFFAWRITFGLTNAVLQGQARFRSLSYQTLFEGGGLMLVVSLAALADPDPTTLAWACGVWLLVARLSMTLHNLRAMSIPSRTVLGATLPAWLIALVAGAVALALDHLLTHRLQLPQALTRALEPTANVLLIPRLGAATAHALADAPAQLLRVAWLALACAACFAILARLLIPRRLVDLAGVLPARVRPLANRLLRLPT